MNPAAPTEADVEVWVCHASPVVQAGLTALLAPHANLNCASDDGTVLEPGLDALPEVIVADHRRGIEWAEAFGRVPCLRARPRVLVVTHSDRECDIRAAMSAGVQGYVLIDDAPEQLIAGIRDMQRGARFLSPKVASRLAENVSAEALTQREQAVLGLVVEGLCNKLIASQLGITAGTVKCHLRSAFGKLGAASRTQAIAIAHRRGLLQQTATAD